jgi:large subunit ribosomal protein L9
MKVVLLQHVPKVGKKYEIVEVAPGYARNFLVARGLAEAVTRANVARVEELKKRRALEVTKEHARMEKAAGELAGKRIEISRETNEEGGLYAQISLHDIAQLIEEKTQVALPVHHIHLAHQVKTTGEHAVKVEFGEKTVEFTLVVSAA